MNWKTIGFLLCLYGFLKEFKPIEPYLYQYQNIHLNISRDVLNSEVYPYWTYSYLVLSIPTMLLTDLLLYKPILLIQSLSLISVWVLLIFGRSVLWQKIGQILYGLGTATEVAYFAYAYVKMDKQKYSLVSTCSRAILQFGKCFAYLLAQFILIFELGDYMTLNQISLGSLILMFLTLLALPWVNWHELVEENEKRNEQNGQIIISQNYFEFASIKMKRYWTNTRETFSDTQILRWSIWWAMATCGNLQIGNYIQLLWGETQIGMANSKIYNGFVEAFIPLLAALTLMGMEMLKMNWTEWGELAMASTALFECICLVGMAKCENLYFLYLGYAICRILYQISITLAQFNIAIRIHIFMNAFIFGLNMFIALLLESLLTFLFVDSHGPFQLEIRHQFIVYGVYHGFISAIFLLAQFVRKCL